MSARINNSVKRRNAIKSGEKVWTEVYFGRHKGKTLPQIILSDPDWFFWAVSNNVFKGPLARQAEDLERKATAIKIPKRYPRKWEVEYRYEHDGQFIGFGFVKADSLTCTRSYSTIRLPYLDLSRIRQAKTYDKKGGKKVIRHFRVLYFGVGSRLTKRRCEEFFDDERNFVDLR